MFPLSQLKLETVHMCVQVLATWQTPGGGQDAAAAQTPQIVTSDCLNIKFQRKPL